MEKWEGRALAKGPRERAVLKKLATTPKGRIRRLNSCAGSKFRERSSRKEGGKDGGEDECDKDDSTNGPTLFSPPLFFCERTRLLGRSLIAFAGPK